MNAQTITATPEFVQQEVSRGRQYCLLFLTPGTLKSIDSVTASALQMKHLEYLFTLKLREKLSIFGPVMDNPNIEGLCIFDSEDKDEVKKLIEEDAYIQSGAMGYEIYTFFSIPGYKLP